MNSNFHRNVAKYYEHDSGSPVEHKLQFLNDIWRYVPTIFGDNF